MGRGAHCSEDQRKIIINLKNDGKRISEISKLIKCSRGLVRNAIKQYEQSGTTKNKIKKGRNRITTRKVDRIIVRMSKNDPFLTSSQIKKKLYENYNINVSSKTIRRRLNEAGLRGCIAKKKPLVSQKNIKERLKFARTNKDKPLNFWKNILWSDESKFNLFGSDGKTYVRRPKNKENDPKYTKKTVKFGGGNIMVWGAMSWHGVGPLVKVEGRMDQNQHKNILEEHLENYTDENLPITWKFMHDNDPKHKAKSVQKWLKEHKISVLDWPPQSPDLNPIENLWYDIEKRVRSTNCNNVNNLWATIQTVWYNTPKERCQKLVASMQRRCEAVITSKGYPTKY